ncbi:hypothetical protein DBV15_07596, partial [Temnothorax longispinosus]
IETRKGYRSPSRVARCGFDYRSHSQQRASRISTALWTRNTTARAAAKSFLFALLRDIAPAAARADSRRRARIFIAEKCKGGRREYSPRGQSAPAKEGTDISRRKRRFRVVVPLFAVGIIIGLPGNPGRAARWLVRFRVRQWKPTTVQKEERRAGSSVAKGRKRGICMSERRDEAGDGRTRGRRAGFWLRIVANHFNCARSSLEPLMASSVSDTAASGSSGRSSTSRCSPPRTKTPRKRTRAMGWESHALLLLLTAGFEMFS